jgi:hypothetical protein
MLTRLAALLAALHLPHRHEWQVTPTDDDECAFHGCTAYRFWPSGERVTRAEAMRRARAAL